MILYLTAVENMELPSKFKHLRIQLADVDTQNIAPFFNTCYAFVEEGRAAGHGDILDLLAKFQHLANYIEAAYADDTNQAEVVSHEVLSPVITHCSISCNHLLWSEAGFGQSV